jgi:hypothetical protein
MYCLACGAWSEGDLDTGYDADDICPECANMGWYLDEDGHAENDTRYQEDVKKACGRQCRALVSRGHRLQVQGRGTNWYRD